MGGVTGGWISGVLSFARAVRGGVPAGDVKVARPEVSTPEHFGAPGDDSPPLSIDAAAGFGVEGTGRAVTVGYSDRKNAGIALPGEKRYVGRDEAGEIVSVSHMKRDGSLNESNDNASRVIAPDGTATFGNPTAATTIGADGRFIAANDEGSVALDPDGSFEVQNTHGRIELGADGALAMEVASFKLAVGGAVFEIGENGAIEITAPTFKISNGAGVFELGPGGVFLINGAMIDPSGDVRSAAGVSLTFHLTIGSPTAPAGPISNTGVPIPS